MVLILKFPMQTKFNHKWKFKKTELQFLRTVNFSSKEFTGQSSYQKKHLILYMLT